MTERRGRSRWPAKRISGSSEKIMDELLKYAVENGIIDLTRLQNEIKMNKRSEILKKHPYAITQGKDGKWRTYIPDSVSGRRMLKRSTRESIEEAVFEYWVIKAKNDTTVETVFENWLNEKIKLNEISEATYWRYRRDFKRFFCDERDFSGRKISEVTYADVEVFLRSIISQGLTAKTFGNARVLVYGIFKRAKREGLISWSITQLIGDMEISRRAFKKTIKNDYQEVFSDEEMQNPAWQLEMPDFSGLERP